MEKLSEAELSDFLESKYYEYNTVSFIAEDPVSIPHRYTKKEDIEISGFLVATFAWGKRASILKSAMRILEMMENSPYDFILNFKLKELKLFDSFVHRTFNGEDCKYFFIALQHIYREKGGLNNVFFRILNVPNYSVGSVISNFKAKFFSLQHPVRTEKHIGDPLQNSSAKRICMFLRWMVRRDASGVDFGIWRNISPSVLAIPLDIHSGRVAQSLGLLSRNQNDWKSVVELTNRLKKFDLDDPVKYDFALFGLGVNEKFR